MFRLTAGTVASWCGMLYRNKQRKMYVLGKLLEIQDHLEAIWEMKQLVREEEVEKVVLEGQASQHPPLPSSSSGGDTNNNKYKYNNNKSETSSTSGDIVEREEEGGPSSSLSYTLEMEPLHQYASLSHSPSSSPSEGADKKKEQ